MPQVHNTIATAPLLTAMLFKLEALLYSTAHVQVYKKTRVMIRASRNFAFNSRVGLVRHERILLASDN